MAGTRDEVPELRQRLRELHRQVGRPTYKMLKDHADRLGQNLPTSTTGDLLNSYQRPRWDTVETFVRACAEHALRHRVKMAPEAFDLGAWQGLYDQPTPAVAEYSMSAIGRGLFGVHFEDQDAMDPDETLKQAQHIVQEDPSPGGYSLAGTILTTAGLNRAAVKYFLRSLEDQDEPATWFNLGQAYESIGEMEKASEALIRALRFRRDFAKLLMQRQAELPERVRDYLADAEERYQRLLDQRCSLMEEAIADLKPAAAKAFGSKFTVTDYEVRRGTNLAEFVFHLHPEGVAVIFCYPEELHDAEIVMPFQIPEGVDFAKQKSRFKDHFGYAEMEFHESSDEPSEDLVFFVAQLKYERLSADYLLRWILQSVIFPAAGEAFLKGESHLEVKFNDGGAKPQA